MAAMGLLFGILFSAAGARADVVPPDCVPRFPAEENDSCARDRAVVIFHNACGTSFSDGNCHIRKNPGLINSCGQLKDCMHDGDHPLGRIAGHVLGWQLKHACEGNQKCISIHEDICLGKGDGLQLRRRLVRCSQKARNKLNGWSAELFQAQTGNNNQNGGWDFKFGQQLAEEVAKSPPGAGGGPPGSVGDGGSPEGGSGAPPEGGEAPPSGDADDALNPEDIDELVDRCIDRLEKDTAAGVKCFRTLRRVLRASRTQRLDTRRHAR